MQRRNVISCALAVIAMTAAAKAAIGDQYVRVVYCSAQDGGQYVYYGAGTCAHATKVLAMFGHTLKECQQLVVVGGGTVAGDYGGILDHPAKVYFSGPLVNLGEVGQGVVVVWRPDGLPHAVRYGPAGIEIAQLPLPDVQNGEDLETFMLARGGGPTRWVDDTFIQSVQGDFEILYETPSTANPPERAPFSLSSLQFIPARLPCNVADLAFDYDVLDLQDINAFVAGFTSNSPSVDLNGDGLLDLQDINAFVAAFLGGCP